MKPYFTRDTLDEKELAFHLQQFACPLHTPSDLDPLMKRIGEARVVMLGEASHGTHEYYVWRNHITRRLIEEKGFNFIAVEGDWPDCYLLNRYIKGYYDAGESVQQVLHHFNRWPTWMWGNWEVAALCEWLVEYNSLQALQQKVGFYGLDVYSLWESIDAIMRYLKKTDKEALRKAQQAFDCFEPYRHDEGQTYAHASQLVPSLCENEVVELLKEIQARMPQYDSDFESAFSTHQNALVVMNAERYYRAMVQGGAHSWNIRDRHMEDTLTRLLDFHGEDSKAIIWAHNTHIGDARATDMTDEGMYNLGELARLEHAEKGVVLVGFGSYQGSVIASRRWGATMKVTGVPEARKGSWEQLLHHALGNDSLLMMDDLMQDILLENHIDHRAIGVVYNPELEAYGNYVPTILPLRYDAFIHLEKTTALHAMHIKPDGQQVPETYPFGL